MKHLKIFEFIEDWAPKGIAWEKDNVGLQIGDADQETKGVLLTLDLTDDALNKAIAEKCNLIITHHPLFFNPINKVDLSTEKASRNIFFPFPQFRETRSRLRKYFEDDPSNPVYIKRVRGLGYIFEV